MPRYRLRTLLLLTAFVAVGVAAFKPFRPVVSVQSLVAVPAAEPYSNLEYHQFRLTIRNEGLLSIWLTPADATIPDQAWGSNAARREPTSIEIDIYDDCTKLAAGQTRVYDLAIRAEYEAFYLFINACDWRGRNGFANLGLYSTRVESDGEP